MSQHLTQQERVVIIEVAHERLLQLGDLDPHPGPGHLREHLGITLPSDQRGHHVSSGDPGTWRSNIRQRGCTSSTGDWSPPRTGARPCVTSHRCGDSSWRLGDLSCFRNSLWSRVPRQVRASRQCCRRLDRAGFTHCV